MAVVLQKLVAEFIGSLLLAGVVIGSGILGASLAGGNDGVALLGNTLATAAILFVLVAILGPVSGAHFNPAVSLVMVLRGALKPLDAVGYVAAQILGCAAGAVVAHLMFGLEIFQAAGNARPGGARMFAEGVATFALVFAILGGLSRRPGDMPAIVALTIAAGYWWTSSTSFANPAITLARAMSDTFAGVRPADVPGFIAGQIGGALAGWGVAGMVFRRDS